MNEYVKFAKQFILSFLDNDNVTIEAMNSIYEINAGNKDELIKHIKAVRDILNKALEELERDET